MIRIVSASSPEEIKIVRDLFVEYRSSLGIDLSFQQFDEELDALPGEYAGPAGRLFLAYRDDDAAGCAGIRRIADDTGELKRMYVRPDFRSLGIGRLLAETAIDSARTIGYRFLRLDTLPDMKAAIALYRSLGFSEIPPYRHNPVPGALFLEIRLR